MAKSKNFLFEGDWTKIEQMPEGSAINIDMTKIVPRTLIADLRSITIPPGAYLLGIKLMKTKNHCIERMTFERAVESFDAFSFFNNDILLAKLMNQCKIKNWSGKSGLHVTSLPRQFFSTSQPVRGHSEIFHQSIKDDNQTIFRIDHQFFTGFLHGSSVSDSLSVNGSIAGTEKRNDQIPVTDREKKRSDTETEHTRIDIISLPVNTSPL
jgi:hypothetical protein